MPEVIQLSWIQVSRCLFEWFFLSCISRSIVAIGVVFIYRSCNVSFLLFTFLS